MAVNGEMQDPSPRQWQTEREKLQELSQMIHLVSPEDDVSAETLQVIQEYLGQMMIDQMKKELECR